MMRVLIFSVCVLLVTITLIQAVEELTGSLPQSRGDSAKSSDRSKECNIADKFRRSVSSCYIKSNGGEVLGLMQDHFQLSLNYLLASKHFESQYVQRPGMAKFLSEASDRHWEEGIDVLKKYLQRGGDIGGNKPNFKDHFKFTGNVELTGDDRSAKYVGYLQTMLDNSKAQIKTLEHLHHVGEKKFDSHGDAEFAHYFVEKLEKEVKVTRELAGHVNTLNKMKHLGVALSTFDSHL